ncbi:MAG: hypothetical protein AB1Z98_36215, partial [Nannocystaceae bacterium]
MQVTVLWEDQRGMQARGFGPHELLVACLADDLGIDRQQLKSFVSSHPKKGVTKVRAALVRDLPRLSTSGPVVAVVDRDKALDLWRGSKASMPTCMSGI